MPTDADILRVMGQERVMTYVIRNRLFHFCARPSTAWLRRQLRRLEKEGRIRQVSTDYQTQLCWQAIP